MSSQAFVFLLLAVLPLWLWALRGVVRDVMRPTCTGPDLARCGLPAGPCGPSPAARALAQLRAAAASRTVLQP